MQIPTFHSERDYEEFIKQEEHKISLQKNLENLLNNKDFQALILEHYMKSNALRTMHLMAKNVDVHKELAAVAVFNDFMRNIDREAEQAIDQIEIAKAQLNELRFGDSHE